MHSKEIAAFLLIVKEGFENGTMGTNRLDGLCSRYGIQWILGLAAEQKG